MRARRQRFRRRENTRSLKRAWRSLLLCDKRTRESLEMFLGTLVRLRFSRLKIFDQRCNKTPRVARAAFRWNLVIASQARASRRSVSGHSACGAQVDLAFGERGQLLVAGLFLVEGLLQHGRAVVAAKLLGPRNQAAVTDDLVMLDRLRCIDQCGVQHLLVGDLARGLVRFLD